jgi:hypothetical protein
MQINISPDNKGFYKDLLETLGWETYHDDETMFGAGGTNGASLWFIGSSNGAKKDEVDAAAAYLLGQQIELLFDTPRHRPEFASDETQTYYQIMFSSPDNLLFEVVYTGPKQD